MSSNPASAHASGSSPRIVDLRNDYPTLDPDTDYPPLELPSLKGQVSAQEWQARVDCACAYRLVHHFDMHDLIYNHISVRIPGTEEYLLNPFGMTYDEITASSLIKVDINGNVLFSPDFPPGLGYKFNPAGYVIHSAIHAARGRCDRAHPFACRHGGVGAGQGLAADDADCDALRQSRLP